MLLEQFESLERITLHDFHVAHGPIHMVAGNAVLKAEQRAAAAPREVQRLALNPWDALECSRSMAGSASNPPLPCQLCSEAIKTEVDDHIKVCWQRPIVLLIRLWVVCAILTV